MDADTKQEFDKLATMMAAGFADVNERFEAMDVRFEAMDSRFDAMDKKLEEAVAELRSEIKSVRAELERIPDDIDATYSRTLNDLLERVAGLERRIVSIESTQRST